MIQKPDGTQCYTRNGHFNLSKNTSGGWSLTTQEGYAVLDSTGKEISFDADVDTSKLRFDNYGGIGYVGDDGTCASAWHQHRNGAVYRQEYKRSGKGWRQLLCGNRCFRGMPV